MLVANHHPTTSLSCNICGINLPIQTRKKLKKKQQKQQMQQTQQTCAPSVWRLPEPEPKTFPLRNAGTNSARRVCCHR